MAGKRKYIALLFVTACIIISLAVYGMIRYNPRQGKPDEGINNPPIGRNTGQKEARPPLESPQQSEAVPQPAPVPKPLPPPTPMPVPKPAKKVVIPKESIGGYKTPILDKNYGRTENIKLAAKRINGYVVEPGGSFSFNEIVGERTEQKGYKPAKVIINGKFEDDTGGGICQLSSTLYNAAEKAGLQIVERHPHSKKVSYIKEGCDAAVDYGNLDLKFKNTTGCPIEVRVGVQNGEVYAFIVKVQKKAPVSP